MHRSWVRVMLSKLYQAIKRASSALERPSSAIFAVNRKRDPSQIPNPPSSPPGAVKEDQIPERREEDFC